MNLTQLVRFLCLEVCLFLMVYSSIKAQGGIYAEISNYNNGNPRLKIPCIASLSRQDQYDFYKKKYIKLSPDQELKKVKKKDIWGYRDCNKKSYKVNHGLHYEILEDDQIIIYKLKFPAKGSLLDFTLGFPQEYYFSKDHNSQILLLTIENIEEVYSDNRRFLESLHQYLESSFSCIHCYDTYTKSFIINKLIRQSGN